MLKERGIQLLLLDVDGTMTDGGIYIMDDGKQFKKFHSQDGLGIILARKKGLQVGIISHSHSSEMVDQRANTLGLKYVYVGQEPKLEVLERWLTELKITLKQVAFMGDDLNDLEIMQAVGVSICPDNAVSQIKSIADIKLTKKGGDAAVRELLDNYFL